MHTPEIYDDLQRKLMTAAFSPGEKLKPAILQGEYGCSANTVRDVLLRLSKVGLVDFEMQRGFRARATTPERRTDVTRFRILLEQEGARLSMAHGGLPWEARLSAAHHKLSHIESELAQSDHPEPYMGLWSDAEFEFHETLISACGSPLLIETYANTYVQFRQQMVSQERDFGANYFQAIISEHQAILDAALARNVEACKCAIHDHLKRNL
ncbi:MAG: GntR family transcriptional regulator [Pseudomonadota bacterium]